MLSLGDLVEQLSAVAELSHQHNDVGIFKNFIKTHDVWMLQVLENIDFILQSDFLILVHVGLVNDLDSTHFLVAFLNAFLHPAEGT